MIYLKSSSSVIYTLVIIISTLFLGTSIRINKKNTRYTAYIIITCFTSLFAAFRGNAGTDTNMYHYVFNTGDPTAAVLGSDGRWQNIEKGYMVINSFCRKIMPFEMFLFILSFITIFLIIICIENYRKYVNSYVSAFVLYTTFYLNSFNMVRQALAISLCMFAFFCYLDNKIWLSLMTMFLALTIHTSALIFLFIYISKIIFKKEKWVFLSLIIIVFLVFNRQLFGQLVLFLTKNNYYAGYFIRDAETNGNIFRYLLRISPILIVTGVFYPKLSKNMSFRIILVLMVMGYLLFGLNAETDTQVGRIGLYFETLNIFGLGIISNNNLIISKMKVTISKNIVSTVLLLYLFGLYTYSALIMNNGQLIPYGSLL